MFWTENMGSIAAQLQYHCLLDYRIVADSAILTNFLYCFFFPRIYKNNLYPLLLAVRCRFPDRIFPCFSDPFPGFSDFLGFPTGRLYFYHYFRRAISEGPEPAVSRKTSTATTPQRKTSAMLFLPQVL